MKKIITIIVYGCIVGVVLIIGTTSFAGATTTGDQSFRSLIKMYLISGGGDGTDGTYGFPKYIPAGPYPYLPSEDIKVPIRAVFQLSDRIAKDLAQGESNVVINQIINNCHTKKPCWPKSQEQVEVYKGSLSESDVYSDGDSDGLGLVVGPFLVEVPKVGGRVSVTAKITVVPDFGIDILSGAPTNIFSPQQVHYSSASVLVDTGEPNIRVPQTINKPDIKCLSTWESQQGMDYTIKVPVSFAVDGHPNAASGISRIITQGNLKSLENLIGSKFITVFFNEADVTQNRFGRRTLLLSFIPVDNVGHKGKTRIVRVSMPNLLPFCPWIGITPISRIISSPSYTPPAVSWGSSGESFSGSSTGIPIYSDIYGTGGAGGGLAGGGYEPGPGWAGSDNGVMMKSGGFTEPPLGGNFYRSILKR